MQGNAAVPARYRFRLKELWQPTENLQVYSSTPPAGWVTATPSATLAENIIALIILPKLPQGEDATGAVLAPNYVYDSTDENNTATHNQLPPLVQVVMVAIDEVSARREENGSAAPDYGVDWDSLFQNAQDLDEDLKAMEQQLAAKRLNFQIFNSTVVLEGAKWSR